MYTFRRADGLQSLPITALPPLRPVPNNSLLTLLEAKQMSKPSNEPRFSAPC